MAPPHGTDPARLTRWQRRALKSLAKYARSRNGDPLSPMDWAAYLEFNAQPRSRAVKRMFRALPSTPRCGFCGAPFAGFGARLVGPLGYRPSRKNPSFCASCVELAPPGGVETEAGVLFADIRGFTTTAESHGATHATALLRQFYAHAEGVFFPEALIDKVIGDAVMALYLPVFIDPDWRPQFAPESEHVDRPKVAAMMVGHARRLLERVGYGTADGPAFEVGIGIDLGDAFVGNVGNAALNDFTAVGDVVNTASRLQGVAGGGEVVVSERVAAVLPALPPTAVRETITLEGKQDVVTAYRIRWFAD